MPIIGRRKPGFAKIEYLRKDEIPGEFSDALDPAMHKEEEPCNVVQEDVESIPRNIGEMLAGYIRMCSEHGELTAYASLRDGDGNIDAVLDLMNRCESCQDIACYEGEKDRYFYSAAVMTQYYAMINVLAIEKNHPRIIAEIVRFNCATYPAATPVGYFERTPYSMTGEEIKAALQEILHMPEYEDIQTVKAESGAPYLYSRLHFTDKYAKAMADYAETDERNR